MCPLSFGLDGQYPYGYDPYGIMEVPSKLKSFEHEMERPHEGYGSSTWEGENAAHNKKPRGPDVRRHG
jgi:hypothetical protein